MRERECAERIGAVSHPFPGNFTPVSHSPLKSVRSSSIFPLQLPALPLSFPFSLSVSLTHKQAHSGFTKKKIILCIKIMNYYACQSPQRDFLL